MIKTIVKRNGQEEPYIPSKLNSWGKWAAATSGKKVDWSSVVIEAVSSLPERVSSSELQEKLISACLERDTYSYYMMAGRLYAAHLHKTIHGPNGIPHLKSLQEELMDVGLMAYMDYDQLEYNQLNDALDHELDFSTPHFALDYIRKKYSLRNRVSGKEYETQQFVLMRMSMELASSTPKGKRVEMAKRFYKAFNSKILSAPTPNYVNLGTRLRGFASCCLYATGDTIPSLAAGDHIAYIMTASSAGIGGTLLCRSENDPVRGGQIVHQGKLPYYALAGKLVSANMQSGRGGAMTMHYTAYDPEASTIVHLFNPRSTENKRNRDLHYSFVFNSLIAEKVIKNEKAFSFNHYRAPDLAKSFYSGDPAYFKELYNKYDIDANFKKEYFSVRDLVVSSLNEAIETGVSYVLNIDEMNKHTPFKEPIHSSNLCQEIAEHTSPYETITDLYSTEEVGFVRVLFENNTIHRFTYSQEITKADGKTIWAGILKPGDEIILENMSLTYKVREILELKVEPEVAMCSLAAQNLSEELTDEEYEESMYLGYKMIDHCILNSHYALPHIGVTAKARMSAGFGIMGLATHMARKGLSYASKEGLEELHRVAERHMYFAIKASLRISKERGLAPWMHKTKWVDGWIPLDTYNRNVDLLGDFKLQYDWEALRQEIIANKGIAHTVLVAFMPGESSSKALGVSNSLYPIRSKTLVKTDNGITSYWAAPYSDDENYVYESAWDIEPTDMIKAYAVIQKFTDQAISADLWRRVPKDEKIPSSELIKEFLVMVKYGMKSRYYYNSNTANEELSLAETGNINNGDACVGGGCTL